MPPDLGSRQIHKIFSFTGFIQSSLNSSVMVRFPTSVCLSVQYPPAYPIHYSTTHRTSPSTSQCRVEHPPSTAYQANHDNILALNPIQGEYDGYLGAR